MGSTSVSGPEVVWIMQRPIAGGALPKTFQPCQAIPKSFSGWAAAGAFGAMHDRLHL
jgi:hypothetical protein